MKKLISVVLWTIILSLAAFAQTKEEREVLKFIADYDQAAVNQDLAFAERVLAAEYVYSGSSVSSQNRAKVIEEAQAEKANPKFKLLSLKSINDSLRINGNTAIASGTWTSSTVPIGDLQSEPHIDRGRYTMVLEKRDGSWMVVAEHISESQHDKQMMEAALLKASKEYDRIMVQKDRAGFEKLFTDDFISTSDNGRTNNKAEEIDHMLSPDLKIETSVTSDQKIKLIGNSAALETGIYTTTGTSKGKPFAEKGRYTTAWVFRDGLWQITSDHSSEIKK